MKTRLFPPHLLLRLCTASVGLLSLAFSCTGATNSVPPPESAVSLMSRILASREVLERELRVDVTSADSAQLESLRLRVAEQARQLSKLANDFYQQHPTNASRFQAEQQAVYSSTLLGMVSRKDTSRVWSMSEGINSCLSKSRVIETYSVSPESVRDAFAHRDGGC